jgi:uncharacterized protein
MWNLFDQNTEFFALARRGKRLTHAFFAVMIVAWSVLLGQVFGVLLLAAGFSLVTGRPFTPGLSSADVPNTPLSQGAMLAAILITGFGLSLALLSVWTRFFEKRPLWTIGYPLVNALRNYLRGLLTGTAMFALAVGVLAVFGFVAFEDGPPDQQGLVALGGVLVVFIGWLVQGGVEEALIRGWLMQTIGARNRPWIGVLVSSLVFVALHGLNPNPSVLAFVNLFLFSLFAAAYALREGSLWGISAWHGVWNWVQGNVFGLEVSGNNAAGGILVNLRETGPDLITGGAFGPEGGLAVSAMLLIGIALLLISARRGLPEASS